MNNSAHIAIILSAVARLQYEFEVKSKAHSQPILLKIAADILDCSAPSSALMEKIRANRPQDQVDFLVNNRTELNVIYSQTQANLTKRLRIRPSQWPKPHAAFIRRIFSFCLVDAPTPEFSEEFSALLDWLEPSFVKYPALRNEINTLEFAVKK